jgi:hypothetical protein
MTRYLGVGAVLAFAVVGACGDDRSSSGSSSGGGDPGATSGAGEGGSTSTSSPTGSGSGQQSSAQQASTGGASSSSTGGSDGWTCGYVNDSCYCDDVFEYDMPDCPGSWTCCIYWPGDNGNSCNCSNDSDAECQDFLESQPGTSKVETCPP